MKIDKQDIETAIEIAIRDGIEFSEEIDVTTKNIMETIWPIIDYLKNKLDEKI